MTNGARKMIFKTLGEYPEVGVEEARKAAVIFAGSAADGKAAPGKRDAVTFEKAWAHYLEHLLRKANLNKKPARHHANAVKLGDSLILPQWVDIARHVGSSRLGRRLAREDDPGSWACQCQPGRRTRVSDV